MEEIFKDIRGFEGLYQISNLGRVKSLKSGGMILKQTSLHGQEYRKVCLYKDRKGFNKKVHGLVMDAFVPNPENKPFINHIDCNPLNNTLENLEWCTNSENQIHSVNLGRDNPPIGEKNGQAKLCGERVYKIRALSDNYSDLDISKMFNVSRRTINMIVNRKRWAHL